MPDQMPVLRFIKKVFIKVKGTHPGVVQEGLLRDVPSCLSLSISRTAVVSAHHGQTEGRGRAHGPTFARL